jgi:hypothetical protein
MIKRLFLTVLQFVVFCALLAIGGYWDIIHLLLQIKAPALNVIPLWKIQISADTVLVANGLVFATVFLLLLLLLQALRRVLRPWAAISLVTYLAAVVLGFALKLGLPPASHP